jgi:penicillin-binding protein 2
MAHHLIAEPYRPLMLWRDLDRTALRTWALHRHDYPAIDVIPGTRRQVFFADRAIALRGLVGIRNASRAQTPFGAPPVPEEYGLWGVEEALNGWLSGRSGYQDIRVDSFGYRHSVLAESKPSAGSDANLAIDIGIQCMAEHVLGEQSGALVVMNGAGEILALAGNTPGGSTGAGALNCVIGQSRAPGSIIKPLVALAALEAGVLSPGEGIRCEGHLDMGGGVRLHCGNANGHGEIALREALAESCNVYFATVVRRVGPGPILRLMAETGLGRRPGTILSRREAEGVVYGSDRSRERIPAPGGRDSVWYPEDAAHLAIGQGILELSPLQACAMTGAVLTGVYRTPQLLRTPAAAARPRRLSVSAPALAAVRDGMIACVHGENGTGTGARVPGYVMAGKTGTVRAAVDGSLGTNGWMVAGVPAASPEYIITAFAEGGSGPEVAAPLVGRLAEMILTRELSAPDAGVAMTR